MHCCSIYKDTSTNSSKVHGPISRQGWVGDTAILEPWYFEVQALNAEAPRFCPRLCTARNGAAVYEYVTGRDGRAIILRCLNCGELKHVKIGPGGGALFQPPWTGGTSLPSPHRMVHLPGAPKKIDLHYHTPSRRKRRGLSPLMPAERKALHIGRKGGPPHHE